MSQPSRRTLLQSSLALAAGTSLGAAASAASMSEENQQAASQPGSNTKTRFAINIEMWGFGVPFMERFAKVAELGFPAVEFWPWRNKDLPAIKAACAEHGLEVAQFTAWGFVPGMNDPANHGRFVEEVKASCAAAQSLGARKATIVAGNDIQGVSQAEMHQAVIKGLKLAAPIAEDADVMLILEPMNIRRDHKGHCLYGSPDAVRICREVDSTHVKINWDLYHMQISEGDLCGRLREGFDQVGYLQLADHPGRREPGTGEIYYPRVLKEAWELGYRDYVGAECSPTEPLVAAQRLAAAGSW
ncbi:MAG: TIM barrel protein [Planctomycetota bacterium]|jgi:hydroxypyruvate isomerase|nr:TIM barrel protein [Planctomycetota bacterium]